MDHSANSSSSLQSSNGGGGGVVDFHDFSSKYSFFDSLSFLKPSSSSSSNFMTNISPPPTLPQSPNPNHPPCIMTKTPSSRVSKKRPRASRRPPTTVLTTDTSNFRSMVQQFTGIPSPLFPTAPHDRHPHFDFFKPLLYSQKQQQSAAAAAAALNINASNATDKASLLTSFNYQQLPSLPLSSSNLMNITESPVFGSGTTVGAPQYGLIGSGWGQGEGADPTRYGCKLDFSGSGLMEMNGEIKGGDIQARGGEGMVESWISSLD